MPEHCLQRPLHSMKCTAWVAISRHGIIGPFWFEDNNEQVCDNQYRAISPSALQILKITWYTKRGCQVHQWFQQDGATPHTSNQSLAWLQQCFPDQPITRRYDPERLPHSPDLIPPDVYLWGYQYLKNKVHVNNPQAIPDLKTTITAVIRVLPRQECGRVIENFGLWIHVCLQSWGLGGAHFGTQ